MKAKCQKCDDLRRRYKVQAVLLSEAEVDLRTQTEANKRLAIVINDRAEFGRDLEAQVQHNLRSRRLLLDAAMFLSRNGTLPKKDRIDMVRAIENELRRTDPGYSAC